MESSPMSQPVQSQREALPAAWIDRIWGVMRATSHFAEEVGATLHVGWLHGNGLLGDRVPTCYLWPHWYMVKPYADENDVALARVRRTKLGEL